MTITELQGTRPADEGDRLFDPSIDNNAGSTVKEDALVELIEDYNKAYGQEFAIPTWPAMKKDISARLSHKKPYVT